MKIAAVQTSPVFFDIEKTIDKVCSLTIEASKNGAKLIAFPEVFICAYPYWSWFANPLEGSAWFEKMYFASIYTDGKEVEKLKKISRDFNIDIVIGCNEKVHNRKGTIFNSNLIINNKKGLVGVHRKIVPTWAEKLTWASGNGSSLKIYDLQVGKVGTLACGENTNSLARYTLLAQGEEVHIANYISLPTAPDDYNMAEAIKIRAAAHSFEGKIFTIVSCSTISKDMIKLFEKHFPQSVNKLQRKNSAFSGVIGPNGDNYVAPLIDDEGIIYADIDLNKCIQPKQMHDILGHYNRFDIFKLTVNTTNNEHIYFKDNNDLEEKEHQVIENNTLKYIF